MSSASVYSDTTQTGIDETAPVGKLDDPTIEQITGETYGPLKALCESTVQEAMPGRAEGETRADVARRLDSSPRPDLPSDGSEEPDQGER